MPNTAVWGLFKFLGYSVAISIINLVKLDYSLIPYLNTEYGIKQLYNSFETHFRKPSPFAIRLTVIWIHLKNAIRETV